MPTNTTYYNLYLYNSTTDQAESFQSFRLNIAGTAISSNMQVIDASMHDIQLAVDALEARTSIIYAPSNYISANYYESVIAGYTAYTTGDFIAVILDTTSNGTVTLNINSLGTKSLMKVNSSGSYVNVVGKDLSINRPYLFRYDGTRWVWVNATDATSINIVGTDGNFVKINSANNLEDSTYSASSFAVAAKGVTNGDSHDHVGGDGGAITEAAITLADNTTNNVSTSAHGFTPKAPNDTSKFLRGDASWSIVPPSDKYPMEFRLTLASGTPVTTTDQTAKTTIYCAPYKGNQIALYDGSTWVTRTSAEFSVSLGTLTASRPYDVFCFDNSGTPTLEVLSWTSGTARATALTTQEGVLVKSGDATRRYLGTFYTVTTTTTEDSETRRLLWNYYNRVNRYMFCGDTTNSWTYTLNSWRAARANTTDGTGRNAFIIGFSGVLIESKNTVTAESNGGYAFAGGIGLDSTSANSAQTVGTTRGAIQTTSLSSHFETYPSVGYHYVQRLEVAEALGITTWYGDIPGVATMQDTPTGMLTRLEG